MSRFQNRFDSTEKGFFHIITEAMLVTKAMRTDASMCEVMLLKCDYMMAVLRTKMAKLARLACASSKNFGHQDSKMVQIGMQTTVGVRD